MPIILANTILIVAIAILSESALSFLGLGRPARGHLGHDHRGGLQRGGDLRSELVVAAGARASASCSWSSAFTMVGYALDEIINPRIRER